MTAALELHRWEAGRGGTVLCVHETATSSEVWRPLADALGQRARTIAYDRRGWGQSEAPESYLRTTVQEQSEDAARLLASSDAGAAVLCGAGLGAVAALDLLLRRSDLALGAALIEPPLLAFVEEATELLSEDGGALRQAVDAGGPTAGVALVTAMGFDYAPGDMIAALTAEDMGPLDEVVLAYAVTGFGATRANALSAPARERPLSLFAELAALPSWPLPLAGMDQNQLPARIVVSPSSPELLRRSAKKVAVRLGHAELLELPGDRPAHLADPQGLATLILELLRS
ncbi:MAG: hypothetical protein AUG48_00245 [Actinobacteria bacterium 13_1_20CM_3_68_9]|nr:MAG: hypothetical protein AUG48_00245 [Actinobacteria bacterium 13_1_20CM_3_68_9]